MTVIAGPNNSGKTNLAYSLDFLSEVYRHGLEMAIIRKGGYENIAHRKMRRTKSPLEIDLEVILDKTDLAGRIPDISIFEQLRIGHSFSFLAESQALRANFKILSERLKIDLNNGSDWKQVMVVDRHGDRVTVTTNQGETALILSSTIGKVAFGFEYWDIVSKRTEPIVRPTELLAGGRHLVLATSYLDCGPSIRRTSGAPTSAIARNGSRDVARGSPRTLRETKRSARSLRAPTNGRTSTR